MTEEIPILQVDKNRCYELMIEYEQNLDFVFNNYEVNIGSYKEKEINELIKYIQTIPIAILDEKFIAKYRCVFSKNDMITKYKSVRKLIDQRGKLTEFGCAMIAIIFTLIAFLIGGSIVFGAFMTLL